MKIALKNPALYVVVDFGVAGERSRENNIFDRKRAETDDKNFPGVLVPVALYEEGIRQGIQLLTPDVYFAMDPRPHNVIFVRNTVASGGFSDRLLAAGVRQAVILAYENPLYMCQYFYHLEKNTKNADHVFVPKGAMLRVSKQAKTHHWISPMPYDSDRVVPGGWSERKFLTMINANARIQFLRRWYVHFWNAIRPFPSLVDRELYVDRLEAIKFFAERGADFDLYGRGWDRPVRYTRQYDAAIQKTSRGEIADKLAALRQYRFCLVFENCIFDGWVTEKVIDAFVAGCIPVYWGAPDITDYVAENCFIDIRKFKNFSELNVFLNNIDEKAYNQYIKNIEAFFASEKCRRWWSKEKFAKEMVEIFKTYIQ